MDKQHDAVAEISKKLDAVERCAFLLGQLYADNYVNSISPLLIRNPKKEEEEADKIVNLVRLFIFEGKAEAMETVANMINENYKSKGAHTGRIIT